MHPGTDSIILHINRDLNLVILRRKCDHEQISLTLICFLGGLFFMRSVCVIRCHNETSCIDTRYIRSQVARNNTYNNYEF